MINDHVVIPDWRYYATVERVVDGDTIYVTADQGFGNSVYLKLRLDGINTAEIRGSEKEEGFKDMAFVENLIKVGDTVIIQSFTDGGFGRWAATVWYKNPEAWDTWTNLNWYLVDQGIAEEV